MRHAAQFLGIIVSAVALCLFAGATPAAADCNPDTALFSDDFSEFLDATWGDADDTLFVKDDALVVKSYRGQVNFSTAGTDINTCVDVTVADAPDPEYTSAGIIFWWTDWDNYYYVNVWPLTGYVNVNRVLKGKYTYLAGNQPPSIKKEPGATNQLELDLKGKTATFLINGTVATRFKGTPPKDPSPVGIIGFGAEGKPSTFKFDNFIVSEAAQ
jgi:hypothetical protein